MTSIQLDVHFLFFIFYFLFFFTSVNPKAYFHCHIIKLYDNQITVC